MKEKFLTPIDILEPPRHTQIHPRCFTCKKFPVCNIREDYLKTALLIQRILGDPQEDRELNYYNSEWGRIPGYKGYNFINPENYFPESITTTEEDTGTFKEAKYRSKNLVQFIYTIKGYFVLFDAVWDEEDKIFDFSSGREIYYGLKFNLSDNSMIELAVGLEGWRTEMEEAEKESEDLDVINTTYFSAKLECDFYEWEKGLTEAEGIKRIIAAFPNGVPCKDGTYYHLATFHIEPHKVPCYHPENGKVAFAPMPYPVFIPPRCKKDLPRPPRRRGDICDC